MRCEQQRLTGVDGRGFEYPVAELQAAIEDRNGVAGPTVDQGVRASEREASTGSITGTDLTQTDGFG